MDLLLTFAVVDIWGFLLMNPYWLLRAFGKTPNISHATTTGLESAGEKQLNPTVPELIENSPRKEVNLLRIAGKLAKTGRLLRLLAIKNILEVKK